MPILCKNISNIEIDGKIFQRRADFEGIQALSISLNQANIVWKIYILNSQGELLNHPDILQGRIHVSKISNEFRVTTEGVTINEDYIRSITPQEEGELEIDYNYRIRSVYETMYANGLPEFDFYWGMLFSVPLPQVISQSIDIIDSLGGYDKGR